MNSRSDPCLDVEIHHLETPQQLEFTNISVVAQGPLRVALRAVVKYGRSTIDVTVCVQFVSLQAASDGFVDRFRWMLLQVSA
jgi:alpha-mannosidase